MDKTKSIWFVANVSSTSRGGVYRSISTWKKYLQKNRYHVKTFFSNSNYILFSLNILSKYISSLIAQKPNWIIARSTDAFFSLIFIKLFKLNTRVIIYNHGWEPFVSDLEKRLPLDEIDNPTTFKSKLVRFPMLNLSMRMCDYVISGTIFETRHLKKTYKKHSYKFKYIPNAIDIISSSKTPQGNYSFISVANSNWKKNLSYTISLFKLIQKQFPQSTLLCVGTQLTNTEFKEKFPTLERVTNLSSVDTSAINDLYQKSNYLISSSRYEGGHSFAILEAINHNILIFASNIFSSNELISNGNNGVLISGNNIEKDLKIIIDTITINTDNIRQKAKKTIKRYDINNVGPQLERLIK